ncbi:MAG: single-stranded-DNA-specific exonuclease RecJ [Oscillospiraceae bacterium]|nr:single-stranded-DNA-specific exonuclease RecJ [Oscillospiraceae bacterium]
MSRKKWIIPKIDKKRAMEIAEKYDIDPIAASLLISRGMATDEMIKDFCSRETVLSDPFEIKDMDKAVEAIGSAIQNGEKITIYGDYDADGVTSTAILYLFLEAQGAQVDYYIPDRNTEGYGINMNAVGEIAERGTKLIVTVDNGISALRESEKIYSLGMKLVVTDHHKVPEKLPRAEAIVDPHRPDEHLLFDEWSGAGVAFKLVCALSDPQDTEMLLDEFADLVTIGTVADVVTLTGENRAIVRCGVEKINETQRAGLAALKNTAGIGEKTLNSSNIAFSVVPRINAVGRMEHSSLAVELLTCDDYDQALRIASRLQECNMARQKAENEITLEALKQLEENPKMLYDRVLVFDGMNWHGGVIGIVASRFVDKFGKPCIVITSDGEDAKGSGRSIEGFSLYDAINSASHMLTHFGGHVLAAGFGLKHKDIEKFRRTVNDYAKTVDMPFPAVRTDFRLNPDCISVDILDMFDLLEPFGAGNPQPLFALCNMRIENITAVGGGKHLRLTLSNGRSTLTAMKFSTSPNEFPYKKGDEIDAAVRLEKNEYLGETRVSVHIRDIKDSRTDDDKCLGGRRIFEKLMRGEVLKNEELLAAAAERSDVVRVYKYIKQNSAIPDDMELLCYRLGDDGENYCKFLVSAEALCELGLVEKTGGGLLRLTPEQKKVDLSCAPILKKLGTFDADR